MAVRVWQCCSPIKLMLPLVGGSNSAIMLSSVLLPHPDGPTMLKNSPSRTSSVMPSSATTRRFLPDSNTLTTSTRRMSTLAPLRTTVRCTPGYPLRGAGRALVAAPEGPPGAVRSTRRRPVPRLDVFRAEPQQLQPDRLAVQDH